MKYAHTHLCITCIWQLFRVGVSEKEESVLLEPSPSTLDTINKSSPKNRIFLELDLSLEIGHIVTTGNNACVRHDSNSDSSLHFKSGLCCSCEK